MKTFLFVVAFVLGALLTWYLVPRLPPPIGSAPEVVETAPASPAPEPATEYKAMHMADVRVTLIEEECTVETYPPVLCGRVGEDFVWTLVAEERCADYVADLQVRAKAPADPDELQTVDPKPGPVRRATVPEYPERCEKDKPPCAIPYGVTVTSTDPSKAPLTEDPKIDIW